MHKTLVGKENYLFLYNDSAEGLLGHCFNKSTVSQSHLNLLSQKDNYMIFVYPDKCLYYRQYLPDTYDPKYRKSMNMYKQKLGSKCIDMFEHLDRNENLYYKTDTHINFKGNIIVYKIALEAIKQNFNIVIEPKPIYMRSIENEELFRRFDILPYNGGDLTRFRNIGSQTCTDKRDTFYYDPQYLFIDFYRVPHSNSIVQVLNNKLENVTQSYVGKIVNWDLISGPYMLYQSNLHKQFKIVIFYDSFFCGILPLFFYEFREVFFIKAAYNESTITKINPDYIFEFRVERFLQ